MAQPVKKTAKNKGNPNLGPGPGRPKGSPNKTTKALKESILLATEAAGMQLKPGAESGTVAYLVDLAINHKPVFGGLLGRVLPTTLDGNLNLNATSEELDAAITEGLGKLAARK